MNTFHASISKIVERARVRIDGKQFRYSDEMINRALTLQHAVQALGDMHANPSPMMTEAVNAKRVADASTKLQAKADTALRELNNLAQSGISDIQARIDAKAGWQQDSYAQEVRAVFRGLSATEKQQSLKKLFDANDQHALSALLKAPASVTGIDGEQCSKMVQAHELRCSPDEFTEREELFTSLNEALLCVGEARKASGAFVDPAKMNAYEIAEGRAVAAQSAFEATP